MAAGAKTAAHENSWKSEDWTVVLPRRSKQRNTCPKRMGVPEQERSWVPTETESDPDRESKLLQKIKVCLQKLEGSQFYRIFLNQTQTPQFLDPLKRILGSESKVQMVIYGIGSIESFENPRLQLSLAIQMKTKFSWIGDVEVFDPVLSKTESRVLQSLGCTVLSLNEHGQRQASRPTMFFMPHCEANLYDNLLRANWKVDLLQRIVLFGNSFRVYEQIVAEFKNSTMVDYISHILAARRFTCEIHILLASDDYFEAFHASSWQFFSPGSEVELQPRAGALEGAAKSS